MTDGEYKMLWRGVAAGTMVGVALGLLIALFIAMKTRTLCRADPVTELSRSFNFTRPTSRRGRSSESRIRDRSRPSRVGVV